MKEFTSPSGALVVINAGSWDATTNLLNVIRRQLSLVPPGTSLLQSELFIRSAPEVMDAVWNCLSRCTYNSNKITKATFEPVDARQDFEPIMEACIAVNKAPFPQTPSLVFLGAVIPSGAIEDTQEQK